MQKLYLGFTLICAMSFVSITTVIAQPPASGSNQIRVRGIKTQKQQTPEYEVRRSIGGRSEIRQWMQILVAFDTAPKWMDQVDFTYYALVKAQDGKSTYSMFRNSISYVNVKKGSHQSEMYLHPSTLDRYGNVESVAVVVRVNGQVVAIESDSNSKQRWWEQLSPVDGYLLSRNETPFALINFDNFPAVKASTSNR